MKNKTKRKHNQKQAKYYTNYIQKNTKKKNEVRNKIYL